MEMCMSEMSNNWKSPQPPYSRKILHIKLLGKSMIYITCTEVFLCIFPCNIFREYNSCLYKYNKKRAIRKLSFIIEVEKKLSLL